MSEIRRLRILEAGSSELQKLIIMYFPSVSGIVSNEVPEANVREGAVLPMSREWLPIGMEEERNAANRIEKNKYLVFTITVLSCTIVNRRHTSDAFHG